MGLNDKLKTMPDASIDLIDIERALHEGEFCFHYQPKVSFVTGQIVGGEALLRWVKPNGSIVPPDLFLPQAE